VQPDKRVEQDNENDTDEYIPENITEKGIVFVIEVYSIVIEVYIIVIEV